MCDISDRLQRACAVAAATGTKDKQGAALDSGASGTKQAVKETMQIQGSTGPYRRESREPSLQNLVFASAVPRRLYSDGFV